MWKKTFLIIGALLLVCGMGLGMSSATAGSVGICPPGYARVISLEPILQGQLSSKVLDQGCQPNDEGVEQVYLEPIRPGGEGWNVEPDRFEDQGEAVNGFIKGTSGEVEYRCVVFLEPIKPGETSSKASEPVCSSGVIESINGFSLDSSYLITKFYNWTNYRYLLVEYYGGSPCSSTIAYGVTDLPDSLDNKFASGKAYSNCDHISVYDFNDYSGPSYSCGANCSSFYALNDEVSSWTASD